MVCWPLCQGNKICLAPCCNETFVWLPEESASIQLELITEYLNTAPTISCECMRALHSWGKRHGLVIALRDMLNIYMKSINLSSLSCYILLFYKMCINMYKIVLTWVFNRPPTIKPLCKENGGSTWYFWKKSKVLLIMMIVTAHLHQTDTKRVQPCCVAAVPRNNVSGGKDLVFHPQCALWLRAPSSAQ